MSVTAWVLINVKFKVSLTSHKGSEGMFVFQLYFEFWRKYDGRVVSFAWVQQFPTGRFLKIIFHYSVDATQGYWIRTKLAHIKNFQLHSNYPITPPPVTRDVVFCNAVAGE
jgi:hypothetical protein